MPAKKNETVKAVKAPISKPVAAKVPVKAIAPKASPSKGTAPKATAPKAEKHTTLILKKPAAETPSIPTPGKTASGSKVSGEERYQMIQQAAYFIAERHGFQGDSTAHWAEAERQISQQLGKG